MAEYTPKVDNNNDGVDDSLIFTPKPQATSTVDHRKTNSLFIDDKVDKLLLLNTSTDNRCSTSNTASVKNTCANRSKDKGLSNFLINERDLVGSLKKDLDKVLAGIRRDTEEKLSEATNSSLGIIKLDDVDEIKADDTSEVLERYLIPSKEDKCEISWRMMRELARQSISSRRSSNSLPTRESVNAGTVTSNSTSTSDVIIVSTKLSVSNPGGGGNHLKLVSDVSSNKEPTMSKASLTFNQDNLNWDKSCKFNPFDCEMSSNVSLMSEEFISGENVAAKILKDDASWIREKAELPVEYVERSLSGIYPDDERLSNTSSYLRQGSGPVGTLDGNENVNSRPNFGGFIYSPIRKTKSKESITSESADSTTNIHPNMLRNFGKGGSQFNDSSLDDVPTKEVPSVKHLKETIVMNANTTPKTIKNQNSPVRHPCVINNDNITGMNDDRLSVSSVASISHIAEILNDMSINTSPRIIVDRMLAAGSSRSKNLTDNRSGFNKTRQSNLIKKNDDTNYKHKMICIEEVVDTSVDSDTFHGQSQQDIKLLATAAGQIQTDKIGRDINNREDGKENLNNSNWIIPSRTPPPSENLNDDSDSNLFKIPDANKIIKRKPNIIGINKTKNFSKSNTSVLCDTTNICSDYNPANKNRPSKSSHLLIIDAETNKTIYEDQDDCFNDKNIHRVIPVCNYKSEKNKRVSSVTTTTTESNNGTRYSSSNLSSVVGNIINSWNNEKEIDVYDFNIMRMDKLPSFSSIEDLNINCNKRHSDFFEKDTRNIGGVFQQDKSNMLDVFKKDCINQLDIFRKGNSKKTDVCQDDKSVICVSNDESIICLSAGDISCSNEDNNASIINNSDVTRSDVNNVMSVCVGAIVRFTIPIDSVIASFANVDDETSKTISERCLVSIKAIKCDGISVRPNTDDSLNIIRLYYNEEFKFECDTTSSVFEVHVVPLVAKLIEVCLQFKNAPVDDEASEAKRCAALKENVVTCSIKVIGEYPKINIEPHSLTKTSCNGINFGLLPEEALEKSFIKMHNTGTVRVPVVLEISKLSSDILIFYLMEDDTNKQGKMVETLRKLIVLDPGDIIEEPVYCFTPPLTTNSGGNQDEECMIGQVSGQLSVKIAATESDLNVPPLALLQLLALVGKTRVMIAANCNPLTIPDMNTKPLVVRNGGAMSIKLKLNCDNELFAIVGDDCITLEPEQNVTIDIRFKLPKSFGCDDNYLNGNSWKGTLTLSVVSSEIRYTVELEGCQRVQRHNDKQLRISSAASSSSSSGSSVTTPVTSRSSSPCSSSYSRSSAGDLGPLELACTCSALIWASCPLMQNTALTRKSCILRNKRNHREKLLLTVSDPLSSYKIVDEKEKGGLVTEMRLNLEGMESRQISVSFTPTQVGPCRGTLIMTRAQRKSNDILPQPSQKKVLYLYGYGGKSVLNIKGVFRDPELKMWTYLDSNTLQTTFVLENTGDGTAFVKLGQELAATGVIIKPEECLIAAHKSINVELTFSPTAGRAEHLLGEPNSGEVLNITRITIMHGDEATRLRLKRLYSKILNDKQPVDSLLMEKLAVLNNLFPGSNVNEVSTLKDKVESMKTLWLEGIRENIVGVLLERSALENAQLDSTAQFIDLANTIMDETICTSKLQQLMIAPKVVSLSPSQPISSFSLRNTTVLQSRFHIEIPQPSFGLIVEPQQGILPPHTSCLLTVKYLPNTSDYLYNQPPSNASCTVLKIHSDLMNVIEVPVNWSSKVY